MFSVLPCEVIDHIRSYVVVLQVLDDLLGSFEELVVVREELRRALVPSAFAVYARRHSTLEFSVRLLGVVQRING